jgi:hypothetical protein
MSFWTPQQERQLVWALRGAILVACIGSGIVGFAVAKLLL